MALVANDNIRDIPLLLFRHALLGVLAIVLLYAFRQVGIGMRVVGEAHELGPDDQVGLPTLHVESPVCYFAPVIDFFSCAMLPAFLIRRGSRGSCAESRPRGHILGGGGGISLCLGGLLFVTFQTLHAGVK